MGECQVDGWLNCWMVGWFGGQTTILRDELVVRPLFGLSLVVGRLF